MAIQIHPFRRYRARLGGWRALWIRGAARLSAGCLATTAFLAVGASVTLAQEAEVESEITGENQVVVAPGEVVSELRVIDPQADAWLRRIEAASEGVEVLEAGLRYDRSNGLTGSSQRRFGTLSYQAGPPSKFSVDFDRLITGRRLQEQHKRYVYDGRWLVERIEDEKIFIKHRVAPAAGEEGGDEAARDPLALGEGPFPVPVGQKRERILKRFDVAVVENETAAGMENTVQLRLTPRPGHRIDFTTIDLWYDRETLLPRRVLAIDADSEDEMVVEVIDPKVNGDLDASLFDTTPPSERGERGWREEINP